MVRFSASSPNGDARRNGGIPMKLLAQKVQRFLVSEDGPTAVEYAVMLALIVIVCLTAITAIGTKANTVFTNVGSSLGATGS
jgi:pilus assembly protein Flp/PilA